MQTTNFKINLNLLFVCKHANSAATRAVGDNKRAVTISQCRCRIAECEGQQDVFRPDWLQNAVPFEQHDSQLRPTRCLRFSPRNISALFSETYNSSSHCPLEMFDREDEIRCQNWVYDGDEITVVNEVIVRHSLLTNMAT
jgi:hypothetical protein